ncbi:ELM2 and SANT domain containing protein 1 [Dissostichus eleginoides]|uniref:ELM2 and SANT domain containing protein 1 n=1 Tax=Dissostichus eleginoides TaxID=100907 RepID=A0AAD9BUX1_DISEL|nr:ELM2 and SANT domain containing protein 1 [Dissostichus eleginoides]
MSLPSQVNTDKSGKLRAAAMKEPVQHSGDVYYGMGPPALEPSHSDSASSSAVYNPEKGPQSLPHYQQAAPVKWMHQESVQAPGWSQEAPAPAWGQNFGPYMGGVNARGQMAFHKGVHEGVALPMGGESQLPGGPVEVYRDAPQAQAQGRGLEWEQHTAAAMHQAQLQVYQHAHKGVELQDPALPHNGVAGTQVVKGGEVTTEGVIRRRRRASKEINLETLAQKASEMESMPPRKQEEGSSGRQASMMPLVMPVSVPVHRSPTDPQGALNQGRVGGSERPAGQTLSKPSVIVARRRSLRKSISESFGQEGENDPGTDEEGKSKLKRRPRPEPLIIPPPKPATFIPPSLYSSISSYQSNLRSPVRMPDNPLTMPPYTPPPILLLRSTSSDITPPVLSCSLITDATTASLEPRINIGQRYQAEIPDLRDPASSQFDQHKADVVWLTIDDAKLIHGDQECMEDFMNMACCSVLRGGGTNQELVLHCFHESGGDFLETLERLMLQDPVFPKDHVLAGYHYSGSDCWTAEEKRYFNKGISAYRKDFFMVQKLVQSKTVAQCVEFYYTYKKQVKIGRNGILTFGPLDSPDEKHTDAVVDVKCDTIPTSQQSNVTQGETDGDDKKDVSYGSSQQALQTHDYAGTVLVIKEPHPVKQEAPHATTTHRPRAEPAAKKPRAPPKPPVDPDATFPCKKCGRVFYKVKSRSAHMKSHAEQEKKAAALRHREEEEQAAAEARASKAASMAAAAAAAAVMVAANQGGNGNGVTEPGEVSSQEDSSEEEDDKEDDKDEDWR